MVVHTSIWEVEREDFHEFETNLVYEASTKTAKLIQWDYLKTTKIKIKRKGVFCQKKKWKKYLKIS